MSSPVIVSAAVEGFVDEAVIQKLIHHAGGEMGPAFGRNGKHDLRRRIRGYNNAAQRSPWIILVDLDREHECAPELRRDWIPEIAPQLCFRVAVRAVEAWMLADAESLGRFLRVAKARIPRNPRR